MAATRAPLRDRAPSKCVYPMKPTPTMPIRNMMVQSKQQKTLNQKAF